MKKSVKIEQNHCFIPRSFDLILFSINFSFKAPIFFAPKSRSEANLALAAGNIPLAGTKSIELDVSCSLFTGTKPSFIISNSESSASDFSSVDWFIDGIGITNCQSCSVDLDFVTEFSVL